MKSKFDELYESYMSEISANDEADKKMVEKAKTVNKTKYVCSSCRGPQVNGPYFTHDDGTKLCHDCAEFHGVLSDEQKLDSASTKDYSDGASQDLPL